MPKKPLGPDAVYKSIHIVSGNSWESEFKLLLFKFCKHLSSVHYAQDFKVYRDELLHSAAVQWR